MSGRGQGRIALACEHPGCRKPAAYAVVRNGRLMIEVKCRHNGEWHVTYLTIDDLDATLEAMAEQATSATPA